MLGNAEERSYQIIYHEKLKYSGYHEHSSAVLQLRLSWQSFVQFCQ